MFKGHILRLLAVALALALRRLLEARAWQRQSTKLHENPQSKSFVEVGFGFGVYGLDPSLHLNPKWGFPKLRSGLSVGYLSEGPHNKYYSL